MSKHNTWLRLIEKKANFISRSDELLEIEIPLEVLNKTKQTLCLLEIINKNIDIKIELKRNTGENKIKTPLIIEDNNFVVNICGERENIKELTLSFRYLVDPKILIATNNKHKVIEIKNTMLNII